MHGTCRLTALLTIFLFSFSLFPVHAFAAISDLEMQTEDEQLVRWQLSADTVATLSDKEIMEASGNVILRKGDEYLRADFARYHMSTKWVFLQGNVEVRMGKDTLIAEEAEFDLRSRVGWLKNGRIFMEGAHAYLSGERIDKHWGDVYTFKNAKVTTCDGDNPAWSITAKQAVLEIDGYAYLTSSSLQIKNQPVLATPYFLFPTKTRRQTGLLTPDFGRNSQHGFFYNQPMFWAINDHSDLTFDVYAMQDRGVMLGTEYRVRPSVDSTGWLRMDWLEDKITIDDNSNSYLKNSNLLRTNSTRFWLRGMYDGLLPDPNWRFKADLDLVSDQDYLSEFRTNRAGFSRSQNTLFGLFSRDLQERTLDRKSAAMLSRDWERFYVSVMTEYTQDPSLGNGNAPRGSDDSVQRLPQFDAFLHKGRIVETLPLEVDASAQAAYMYRKSGSRGARYDTSPRLTLPLTSRYGSVILQGAVNKTYYSTEYAGTNRTGEQPKKERKEYRSVPEFSAAAFSEVSKVFELQSPPLNLQSKDGEQSRWLAIRHSVQPRVEYNYVSNVDQEKTPYYDTRDRLAPEKEIVYSLTNVLTRKVERVVMVKNEQGELEPSLETGYFDLARLRLEQSYDHREATRNHDRDTYSRRPYSDVLADLSLGITEYMSIYTKNYWSPYLEEITRHQSGVRFYMGQYSTMSASLDLRKKIDEYTRKRDEDLQFMRLDGEMALYGPWSIGGSYSQDLQNSGNTEKHIRLAYTDQCFKIVGQVYVDRDQEEYKLQVILTGLGD